MTWTGRVTMAEIARQARVSISTVSKVLNGRTDVSAETREIVQRLFVEAGYRRPRIKSGAGRGDVIDLVINELDSAWSLALLNGVEEVTEAAGLGLVVAAVHSRADLTRRWLQAHVARSSLGAILVTSDLGAVERAEMARRNVPFVMVDGDSPPPPGVPSVSADNFGGGLAATKHLIGQGHRRIAAISGPRHVACASARIAGYRAALESSGLAVSPELLRSANFNHQEGFQITQSLLALPDRPTAIFAGNDQQALGVYEALQQAGVDIPGQMSVVGFDDVNFARWTAPPLTTVRQPLGEMGATAARTLLSLIDGEAPASAQLEFSTTLVIRESTAPRA